MKVYELILSLGQGKADPNEICQPKGSESFDAHTIFYLTLVGMGGKANFCQGNYHTEAEALAQLKRMSATHSNLREWKMRASAIRRQILVGSKLDPCLNALP